MGQVSKRLISKEIADRIFDVFVKSFIKIRNVEDAQKLADDLFSPTERIMLAKRLAIAFLLMKGYEYREIGKLLGVSTGTIASVNLSLQHGSKGYATILERIAQEEQLEDFFMNIAEKILSLPASISKGGGAWRALKAEIRDKRFKKASKVF